MRKMTHTKKIEWMAVWCARHSLQLTLKGECGIGRECVGVITNDNFPDYEWYDKDYNRCDENGEVWRPEHAYHKHPCVAVLGRGEGAEAELYDWLRWFDKNKFELQITKADDNEWKHLGVLGVILGKHLNIRLVKNGSFKDIYKPKGARNEH